MDRKKAHLLCFSNNLLVIAATFAIVFGVSFFVLWHLRPRLVLDNVMYHIDNGRIILTSVIIAATITVSIWIGAQYYLVSD